MDDRAESTFRRARVGDWSKIWPVFSNVVRTGDTYMFEPEIGESEARTAWMLDPPGVTYVAERNDEIVGTAILKPNQPGLGGHVANAAWMVGPSAAGQGLGRRFACYVIDEALSLGFEAMQFNAVVQSNVRAIRLWTSLGFEIVGTVPDAFRHATRGLTSIHIMYASRSTLIDHREQS